MAEVNAPLVDELSKLLDSSDTLNTYKKLVDSLQEEYNRPLSNSSTEELEPAKSTDASFYTKILSEFNAPAEQQNNKPSQSSSKPSAEVKEVVKELFGTEENPEVVLSQVEEFLKEAAKMFQFEEQEQPSDNPFNPQQSQEYTTPTQEPLDLSTTDSDQLLDSNLPAQTVNEKQPDSNFTSNILTPQQTSQLFKTFTDQTPANIPSNLFKSVTPLTPKNNSTTLFNNFSIPQQTSLTLDKLDQVISGNSDLTSPLFAATTPTLQAPTSPLKQFTENEPNLSNPFNLTSPPVESIDNNLQTSFIASEQVTPEQYEPFSSIAQNNFENISEIPDQNNWGELNINDPSLSEIASNTGTTNELLNQLGQSIMMLAASMAGQGGGAAPMPNMAQATPDIPMMGQNKSKGESSPMIPGIRMKFV